MAITINYEPSGFHSAHNPMYIELQSDNVSQAQFKYIFDIYVNGAFASRQRVFPDPSDDKGYLNISNIVRDYFNDAEAVVTAGSTTPVELGQGEFYVDFYGIYGEDYSGSPFVSGSASGGNYSAYNWVKSNFQRRIENVQSASPDYFTAIDQYKEHFLTNRPNNTKAYEGQPLIITYWGSTALQVKDLKIINQNPSSTSTIASQAFANPHVLDIGSAYDETAESFSVNSYTLADPDVEASLSFIPACHPRYSPVTLMFLNRLGGWDSFTFGLFNEISIDIDKRSYGQNPYVGRSDLIGGGFVRESTKVYAATYKTKWELTGDNLTKDEYVWLGELFTSPLVYVYLPDSTNERNWHPVLITESSYTVKDNLIFKQNFIELTIEFAEPENVQYR